MSKLTFRSTTILLMWELALKGRKEFETKLYVFKALRGYYFLTVESKDRDIFGDRNDADLRVSDNSHSNIMGN